METSRRWIAAAALLASVCGVGLALQFPPYQLDDAYIAYRYAANLAAGEGFAFNPGGGPVEGFTSPLWVLLLAVSASLGAAAELPIVGSVAGGLCLVAALALVWRAERSAIAVVLLATLPATTFYGLTGMETGLFAIVVLACAAAAEGRISARAGLLACALALWVRPEGGWLPVMLLAQGLGSRRSWRDPRTWRLVGAVAAGGVVLLVARLAVFGLPLPHTYYAKGSDARFGASYVLDVLTSPLGAGVLLLGIFGAVVGSPRHRGYLIAALSWVPAVVLEGGDWMPAGRFLVPSLALLTLASAGLAEAATTRSRRFLVTAAVLAAAAWQAAAGVQLARLAGGAEAGLRREARFVSDWMHAAGVRSVATVDIGLTGYRHPVEIVDLGGLTDPHIGGGPGTHLNKPLDVSYVVEVRRPDAVILRIDGPATHGEAGGPVFSGMSGVEQTLFDSDRFHAAYRRAFVVAPPRLDRNPFYGRVVYLRSGFVPAPAAGDPGEVVRLVPD